MKTGEIKGKVESIKNSGYSEKRIVIDGATIIVKNKHCPNNLQIGDMVVAISLGDGTYKIRVVKS